MKKRFLLKWIHYMLYTWLHNFLWIVFEHIYSCKVLIICTCHSFKLLLQFHCMEISKNHFINLSWINVGFWPFSLLIFFSYCFPRLELWLRKLLLSLLVHPWEGLFSLKNTYIFIDTFFFFCKAELQRQSFCHFPSDHNIEAQSPELNQGCQWVPGLKDVGHLCCFPRHINMELEQK